MSPAINLPPETTQRYLTTPSTAIKHPKNTTEAARLCRRYISPNRQYPVASLSHQSMCDCKQSQVPGREREECRVFIQMFMALKKRKEKKRRSNSRQPALAPLDLAGRTLIGWKTSSFGSVPRGFKLC